MPFEACEKDKQLARGDEIIIYYPIKRSLKSVVYYIELHVYFDLTSKK